MLWKWELFIMSRSWILGSSLKSSSAAHSQLETLKTRQSLSIPLLSSCVHCEPSPQSPVRSWLQGHKVMSSAVLANLSQGSACWRLRTASSAYILLLLQVDVLVSVAFLSIWTSQPMISAISKLFVPRKLLLSEYFLFIRPFSLTWCLHAWMHWGAAVSG